MRIRLAWFCGFSLITLALLTSLTMVPAETAEAAAASDAAVVPVEGDMHEFMEYVYQPTFLRLKDAITSEPADNKGWKSIKSTSLILAEAGNHLLSRLPKEEPAKWIEYSVATRDQGGKLYKSAKGKDFKAARQSYEAMIQSCNACHQQFADGEHQLTP